MKRSKGYELVACSPLHGWLMDADKRLSLPQHLMEDPTKSER